MRFENSLSGYWKFAVSAFALLNVIFLAAGNVFALPSDGLDSTTIFKVADGKGPTARSFTTIFNFMTGPICSTTTGQCIEINGKGTVRFNDEIKANGHFLKYKEEDMKQSAAALQYRWTATKLMNGNEIRLHFKATTSLGPIDIAVTEGKGATSGLVCVWGTLSGVTGPNETLCTNKVLVYIN